MKKATGDTSGPDEAPDTHVQIACRAVAQLRDKLEADGLCSSCIAQALMIIGEQQFVLVRGSAWAAAECDLHARFLRGGRHPAPQKTKNPLCPDCAHERFDDPAARVVQH